MNNNKVEDAGYILTEDDIIKTGEEGHIIFQKGKKKFFVVEISF